MILVADCVPILALERWRGIIGVAHAGWRGTVKKVASVLIREMERAISEADSFVDSLE